MLCARAAHRGIGAVGAGRPLLARRGRYRGGVIERSEQGADPPPLPPQATPTFPPPAVPPPPSVPPPLSRNAVSSAMTPTAVDPRMSLGRQLDAGAAPATRSAAWMWLLFAGLGFLGGQVLAALVVSLSAAVSGNLHNLAAITKLSEPPTWYIVSTLIGLWAGFFGAAWVSSKTRGTRSLVNDVGLRFQWIDLVGVPIGVGGQILIAIMYAPIAQHVSNFNQRFDAPSQRLTGSSHGAGYAVIAVCTVVGAPFFEELFFRGVLLRSLARLFGRFGRMGGADPRHRDHRGAVRPRPR